VPFRIIFGDHKLDHTTISRFRKNFATELAGLFIQVLTLCYESGLCNVSTVSVDGTKIKADASMASNRTESGLKKDIKKYFKEADQEDAREGRLRRLKEAQEESTGKKKRGRKPRSAEQVEKEETEKLKANITDPDSRIMKTSKGYPQGYNARVVASEDQIILGAELTSECNDKNQLIPMLERTKGNLYTVDRSIEIGTFLGDAGYFSQKNLDSLKARRP